MGKVKPLEEFAPFFELIAEGWSIRYACRETGTARATVKRRKKADAEFAERLKAAEEEGAEAWEDVLFELARGDRKGVPVAAIAWLNAHRPELYRQNVKHEHDHTLRLQIEQAAEALDARIGERLGRLEAPRAIEAPRNGEPR